VGTVDRYFGAGGEKKDSAERINEQILKETALPNGKVQRERPKQENFKLAARKFKAQYRRLRKGKNRLIK